MSFLKAQRSTYLVLSSGLKRVHLRSRGSQPARMLTAQGLLPARGQRNRVFSEGHVLCFLAQVVCEFLTLAIGAAHPVPEKRLLPTSDFAPRGPCPQECHSVRPRESHGQGSPLCSLTCVPPPVTRHCRSHLLPGRNVPPKSVSKMVLCSLGKEGGMQTPRIKWSHLGLAGMAQGLSINQ